MSETYHVGEIAIAHSAIYYYEHDGCPCVIVRPLEYTKCIDLNTMKYVWDDVYIVKILDGNGMLVSIRPWQIRKLGQAEQNKNKQIAEDIT